MTAPAIRVKAMLVAPNLERTAHAVSRNSPTLENPDGYHRLIGGSVEFGEGHRETIIREVREELDAEIHSLTLLGVVENIFEIDGTAGHEIVFLYSGELEPPPAEVGATLIESDGAVMPVVWRAFADEAEPLPLYPVDARSWLAAVRGAN